MFFVFLFSSFVSHRHQHVSTQFSISSQFSIPSSNLEAKEYLTSINQQLNQKWNQYQQKQHNQQKQSIHQHSAHQTAIPSQFTPSTRPSTAYHYSSINNSNENFNEKCEFQHVSISTLRSLCLQQGWEITEINKCLEKNELIQLIKQGKQETKQQKQTEKTENHQKKINKPQTTQEVKTDDVQQGMFIIMFCRLDSSRCRFVFFQSVCFVFSVFHVFFCCLFLF